MVTLFTIHFQIAQWGVCLQNHTQCRFLVVLLDNFELCCCNLGFGFASQPQVFEFN